jgi:hypothetical protein
MYFPTEYKPVHENYVTQLAEGQALRVNYKARRSTVDAK